MARVLYQIKADVPLFDPSSVASAWYVPLSEPPGRYLVNVVARAAVALIASGLISGPTPSTIEPGSSYESTWHQPWSEPVRVKPREAYFEYQAYDVLSATQLPGNSYESTYHQPWSEPVRLKPGFRVGTDTEPAFVAVVETVTVDKWFVPYQGPTPPRASLGTASQQVIAHAPFNEDFRIEAKWYQPWSEPVRLKPGFKPGADAEPAYVRVPPAVVSTTTPMVGSQWDGPIFSQTIIPQDLTYTATELVLADKWFVPLRDPPSPKVSLRVALQQDQAATNVVQLPAVALQWFTGEFGGPTFSTVTIYQEYANPCVSAPVTTPVLVNITDVVRRQPLFQYQVVADVPNATVEVVTVDKWFVSFQDPVRVKPALRTGNNPDLSFDPAVFTRQIEWIYPLSEPVRLRPGLSVTGQSSFTFGFTPIIPSIGWLAWLSEPKRLKPGLLVTEQSSFTSGFKPIVITADGWAQPWSEPVRFRVFGTHLQKDTIFPYQTLADTRPRFSRGYIIC